MQLYKMQFLWLCYEKKLALNLHIPNMTMTMKSVLLSNVPTDDIVLEAVRDAIEYYRIQPFENRFNVVFFICFFKILFQDPVRKSRYDRLLKECTSFGKTEQKLLQHAYKKIEDYLLFDVRR